MGDVCVVCDVWCVVCDVCCVVLCCVEVYGVLWCVVCVCVCGVVWCSVFLPFAPAVCYSKRGPTI